MLSRAWRQIWSEICDSPVEICLTAGVVLVVVAFWPDAGRRMLAVPGVLLLVLTLGRFDFRRG